MSEVSSYALDALVDIDTCPLLCPLVGVRNENDIKLRSLTNEFFIQNDDNFSENEMVMNSILIL